MDTSSGSTGEASTPRRKSLRQRFAAALSSLAVILLSLAGAWYFGAALWWLRKHDWPDWSWMSGLGWGRGAGMVIQYLASRSPGATALIAAAVLVLAARLVDPGSRRN